MRGCDKLVSERYVPKKRNNKSLSCVLDSLILGWYQSMSKSLGKSKWFKQSLKSSVSSLIFVLNFKVIRPL